MVKKNTPAKRKFNSSRSLRKRRPPTPATEKHNSINGGVNGVRFNLVKGTVYHNNDPNWLKLVCYILIFLFWCFTVYQLRGWITGIRILDLVSWISKARSAIMHDTGWYIVNIFI